MVRGQWSVVSGQKAKRKRSTFYWDRGRPARREHRRVREPQKGSTDDVMLALRARCGRDARSPSEELEWFSVTNSEEEWE